MPLVRPLFPALTLLLVVGCSGSAPSTAGNSGGAATTATPVVAANRAPASPVAAPSPSLAAPSPSAAAAVPSPSAIASPSAVAAQGVTVNMTDAFKYEPDNITIPRGTTVTWVNTGQSPHTVTDDPTKAANAADAALPSGAQPWSSDMINAGQNFQRTFDTPGQYTYFCIPHEALGMVAHITVTP